jgi:hypothetical protein
MPSRIERAGPSLRSEPNSNVAVFAEPRFELVAAFATLPPEAFTRICDLLFLASRTSATFAPESRPALEELGRLAERYMQLE